MKSIITYMGYYRPDAGYGRLKPYQLRLDPVELLGGVSSGYFKPGDSYQKNIIDNESYRNKPMPVYTSNPSNYMQDPIARLSRQYAADPELQPDSPEVQIKKLLSQ